MAAIPVAFAIAAWVVVPLPGKSSGLLVRHDDGLLAIHVWRERDLCWYLDARGAKGQRLTQSWPLRCGWLATSWRPPTQIRELPPPKC